MGNSAWADYLDALEDYLESAAAAMHHGEAARRPAQLASRPGEALPAALASRASSLRAELERLAGAARRRRGELLALMKSIDARGRVEARRVGRLVNADL